MLARNYKILLQKYNFFLIPTNKFTIFCVFYLIFDNYLAFYSGKSTIFCDFLLLRQLTDIRDFSNDVWILPHLFLSLHPPEWFEQPFTEAIGFHFVQLYYSSGQNYYFLSNYANIWTKIFIMLAYLCFSFHPSKGFEQPFTEAVGFGGADLILSNLDVVLNEQCLLSIHNYILQIRLI